MQNTRVLVGFLIRAVVVGLAVAFLVVWWNPTLLGAHTAAAPWQRPEPRTRRARTACPRLRQPNRGHAKLCRFGGARGACRGQYLHGPRGDGSAPKRRP